MNVHAGANGVVTLSEALRLGPPPPGNLAVPVFGHGTLEVEFYAPRGEDRQRPHKRDEVYVVAAGTADFVSPSGRVAVGPGSFVFVAAGQEHRFEAISADFGTWVLFYGPPGGERHP